MPEHVRTSSRGNRHLSARGRLSRRTLLRVSATAVTSASVGCSGTDAPEGIYLSDPAGAEASWIGAPGGAAAWSPSGDQIVWGTEDGLYSSKPVGGPPTVIWTLPVAGKPAWSPDGSELAFYNRLSDALTVIEASTGQIRFTVPVANPSAPARAFGVVAVGGPAWSPDGSRIAFNCWDGAGDEVCTVQTDGSERHQVTQIRPLRAVRGATAPAHTGPPAWSPDGKYLALGSYAERAGSPAGVFIVDVSAGRARRLSPLIPSSVICWYPDGLSIAFAARRQNRNGVFRVPLAGVGVRELTADLEGNSWDPALGPGGTDLAVADHEGIIIVSNKSVRVIRKGAGLRVANPTWRPDGLALIFRAVADRIAVYD